MTYKDLIFYDFGKVLDRFQKCVEDKEYTERIEYKLWRRLKALSRARVVDYGTHIVIYEGLTATEGAKVCSFKTYDNGFGRFFRTYYIQKKESSEMTYNSITADKIASPTSITMNQAAGATNAAYADNATSSADKYTTYDYGYGYDFNTISNIGTISTLATEDSVSKRISELETKIKNELDKKANIEDKNGKENEKMKSFNLDFGPCTGDNIRMSMYGLAVKNTTGTWVSYDTKTSSIMDVDIFNFDGSKYLYKIPVPIKDIHPGDVVIHARKPMFVRAKDVACLTVVDPVDGEMKDIMLTKSPFGFNFATKVVSLFDTFTTAEPSDNQPFGNMLPLFLMSDTKNFDPLMVLMMMNKGDMSFPNNPMMMYLFMKDKQDFDPMVFYALSGGFAATAPANGQPKAD
jgi:hypothetical protein